MRRSIVATDIGLELDDAPDTSPGGVVADESSADQRAGRVNRRACQEGPIDDAQIDGYRARILSGMNKPVSRKKNGMTCVRKISVIFAPSSAPQKSRRKGSS
jgi:hypothetical protein